MSNQVHFDTTQELQDEFRKIALLFKEESTVYEESKDDKLLSRLKSIEEGIRSHSLISSNETIDDLLPEHVPLLNLPYFIGLVFQSTHSGDRISNLTSAESYFLVFLELMQHFALLPKGLENITEVYRQEGKYAVQREEKISLYKEEKALKEHIDLLTHKQDVAQAERLGLVRNAYRTVNALFLLPQEVELLRYRERLQTDEQTKREHDKLNSQPVNPIKFWKIDGGKSTEVMTINSKDVKGLGSQSHSSGSDALLGLPPIVATNVNDAMGQKQLILDRLNQPCFAQPKMTLDQHDELECNLMLAAQERQAEAFRKKEEEKARFGIEDSSDSENEIVSEAKTYRDRQWDDWKDEHEKGSGNRNGR